MVEREVVASREKARSLILAGEVLVNNVPVTKAGTLVKSDSDIRLKNELQKYVSRGGDKLEGVLNELSLDVDGLVCIDVGSSTGGFTDCLLQNGAKKVYCVDVGTNQLDHKIRVDPRVEVFEKTHARELVNLTLTPVPQFAVIDVSFIGLEKILPYVVSILGNGSKILMLVKPQFELGPELISKGGVPAAGVDPYLAVRNLKIKLQDLKLRELGETVCVIKGKKSENQEYFLFVEVQGRNG